tara:strand:- start:186 stop:851 length:666 start_codon:yes stop_codon:yes gene_type:complete
MVNNPLYDVLEKIDAEDFKSKQIILPVKIFESTKPKEVLFPKYDVLGSGIGILGEYMIETLVPEVEQYLKKNDFPDLLYKNHLYEVKAIRDLESDEIPPKTYAGGRVMNYKKVQQIRDKLEENIKGVFLMVIYYNMERTGEEKCRMIINRIEFYNLKVEKINTLTEKVMGNSTFAVRQFRNPEGVTKLSDVQIEYLKSVFETKQEIKKHDVNMQNKMEGTK